MPAPRPGRHDYVHWEQQTTRWADVDIYGHVNNARYFEIIDTAVNNHLDRTVHHGADLRTLPVVGVVAEVGCRYFAEIHHPSVLDVGVAVERIGTSSVVYRVGLFVGEDPLARAEGRFVHVYVDTTDPGRPVTPLPDAIRAAVEPLLRGASA